MNLFKRVSKLFLTGLVFLLPFIATAVVVVWVVSFLTMYLGPETAFGKWLDAIGMHFSNSSPNSYLFGWGIVLLAIILLGFFIEGTMKKLITDAFDNLIKKIPVVGMIYGATRQLTNLMDKSENTQIQSMAPVYCRFGGTYFLALMPSADEFEIEGRFHHIVIIPTAPVPFGGAVIFVPVEDVIKAKMTVEQLLSFYVSMGVTSGDYIPSRPQECPETDGNKTAE